MNVDTHQTQRIARVAKALAHPTRVAILYFLAEHDSCFFGDISEIVPVSKATISQHLTELKNAGLIIGNIQPPKSSYCIDREAWTEVKAIFGHLVDSCIDKKGNG